VTSPDLDRADLDRAEALIARIPDFPEPGILFRDISPLLADAGALRTVVDAMVAPFAGEFDVIAGVEARGFLLAGAAAVAAGVGMVPIRKAGKLPRPAASVSYDLEYGRATIEMADDLPAGTRVLLVDDVLATGGTLRAAQRLLEGLGYRAAGTAVLMELVDLGGQRVCGPVHSVFRV
jgi:adenine phosphoribosyltransferase